MRTKEKKEETPLHELSIALCSDNSARIFQNQIDMFQSLIPFLSNQLGFEVKNYKPYSVDSLIEDIKRYLFFKYDNMISGVRCEPSDAEKELYSCMHRYIINNIANRDTSSVGIGVIGKETDKFIIKKNVFL